MSIVSLPEMKMYLSTDFAFGNFFPAKVMNRDRFDKLCQYFHANDKSNMEMNAKDRLFLVRPILDIVNRLAEPTMLHPKILKEFQRKKTTNKLQCLDKTFL